MKFEYILFDLLVLAGPIAFSFEKRVHYVSRWPRAFLAIAIAMVPYLIWDVCVTGTHWWFNEQYTLDIRLAGLPLGELLFFVAVPFASLFVWECIATYLRRRTTAKLNTVRLLLLLAFPAALLLFLRGKGYTALVLASLAVVALADRFLQTDLFLQPRAYLYLGLVTLLIFAFDSYLIGRPIIMYSDTHRLGPGIGTIPLEDFPYGWGLILLCTIVYERLKARRGA